MFMIKAVRENVFVRSNVRTGPTGPIGRMVDRPQNRSGSMQKPIFNRTGESDELTMVVKWPNFFRSMRKKMKEGVVEGRYWITRRKKGNNEKMVEIFL